MSQRWILFLSGTCRDSLEQRSVWGYGDPQYESSRYKDLYKIEYQVAGTLNDAIGCVRKKVGS